MCLSNCLKGMKAHKSRDSWGYIYKHIHILHAYTAHTSVYASYALMLDEC